MRAVVITTPGGPEVMSSTEVGRPRPAPGQVLVQVEAATVNPVDLQTRSGAYHQLGWVTEDQVGLGWDLAGVVAEIGPSPDPTPGDAAEQARRASLVVGTPVVALQAGVDKRLGAYAEFAVVDLGSVVARPADLDPVAAATAPLNGSTAVQALDLLGAADGRSLLVTGSAGGVGAYAAQVAAERGFAVTGLARADDASLITGLGAAHVVELPGRPTFDAVLDAAVLGDGALAAVRDGGAYVGVVPPQVPQPVRGITTTAVMVTPDAALLTELVRRTAAGELPARVHDVLPLDQAAVAHARAEQGGLRGRLVLRP